MSSLVVASSVGHVSDIEPIPLAQVVGANAKRLRAEATGSAVARAAKKHGLNWGTGRIADLEAGRVSPTLSVLVAFAAALGDVKERPVALPELVEHDGFIALTSDLAVTGDALVRFLNGDPVELTVSDIPGGLEAMSSAFARAFEHFDRQNQYLDAHHPKLNNLTRLIPASVWEEVAMHSGEAEDRAAKTLGVERFVLDHASAALWGKSLSQERDARAAGESAQKRGRVTRSLLNEIRRVLDGDD